MAKHYLLLDQRVARQSPSTVSWYEEALRPCVVFMDNAVPHQVTRRLRERMGHSDIKTTQIYLRGINSEEAAEKLKELKPFKS